MPKKINPAVRTFGKPCRTCGGTERYAKDRKCCHCAAMRQRVDVGRVYYARHPIKSEPKVRIIYDPAKGGAFADSIRDRLRAGR